MNPKQGRKRQQNKLIKCHQSYRFSSPLSSVLITSLNNANAMMHPSPTILNAGRIECAAPFTSLHNGIVGPMCRTVVAAGCDGVA
jgi:hypothetical protein